MTKTLKIALISAPLLMATALQAGAWERHGTVTGTNGRSASVNTYGGCSGNTCGHTTTATGPNGNTASRSHNVTCANGVCNSNATVNGAYYGWTRSANISR
ncbi:hypothetical protein [Rhizobium sp. L1K21]|uniref:hypothetical protein n=1 Tax=Rhizobium sp. L1K21 TaxID=2954933 RepID=UPI0020933122|nr:hypothetical protein [Rhizobium sp. L1K21]MCO6185094.1 hypothetical protein [Rhizobium sp. L1K21]